MTIIYRNNLHICSHLDMNQKIIANINNLTETGTSRIPVNTTKTELIEDFSQ